MSGGRLRGLGWELLVGMQVVSSGAVAVCVSVGARVFVWEVWVWFLIVVLGGFSLLAWRRMAARWQRLAGDWQDIALQLVPRDPPGLP